MINFSKLGKLLTDDKKIDTNISVTCPKCGQVTLFLYHESVQNKSIIICKDCRRSLQNEFLTELLTLEILNRKKVRRFLIISLFISTIPLTFLIIYLTVTGPANIWIYILLFIAAILFIINSILLFFIQKDVRKIKKIQAKFNL